LNNSNITEAKSKLQKNSITAIKEKGMSNLHTYFWYTICPPPHFCLEQEHTKNHREQQQFAFCNTNKINYNKYILKLREHYELQ